MTVKRTAIAAIERGVELLGLGTVRALDRDVIGQFHNPRGRAGAAAGWEMAHRPSNRQRNAWVVSLLDVHPGERVLEIGFGPGVAIAQLSRRVGAGGHVYGIDHSDVMLRQASRRNRAAIAAGRVTLSRAPVDQLLPALAGRLDAVLAVNSVGFWPAPAERLGELRRRLRPGGRIAVASQPRCPGATASTSRKAAREIEALLRDAGYANARTETLDLAPPAVCVLAINPDPVPDPPTAPRSSVRNRCGNSSF
jgi:SAM-dependent methyltransferase